MAISTYSHRLVSRHIRLLELLPRTASTQISCRLFEVSIDDHPDFEALSYVWGNPTSKKEIICDGKPINVTESLYYALERLRYPDKPRNVWADAICINQDDIDERNEQVQLMRDIYSRASRVIVSMAKPDSFNFDIDDLIILLKELESHYQKRVYSNDLEKDRMYRIGDHVLQGSALLEEFFHNAWFTRIWCVQEIVLARKSVLLFAHDRQIEWATVSSAAACIAEQQLMFPGSLPGPLSVSIKGADSMSHSFAKSYRSKDLLFALSDFRHCKATDSKDKVYGLLGLVGSSLNALTLEVDYRKPERAMIRSFHLGFLGWQFLSSETLALKGVIFDTVTSTGSVFGCGNKLVFFDNEDEESSQILELWKCVHNSEKHNPKSANTEALLSKLACSLILGEAYGLRAAMIDDDTQFVQGFLQFIYDLFPEDRHWEREKFPALSNIPQSADPISYGQIACAKLYQRRIFHTKTGYFGFGPRSMQEGDLIVVLYGGTVPFVLRPKGDEYTFIGTCYLYEIMQGELFEQKWDKEWEEETFVLH